MHHYGVLGTGAVGALYGSRLWQAGHMVRFCLRSDLEAGLAQGLQVQSASWGDVTVPPEHLCGSAAALGPLDGLLVALKTTANGELGALLAALETPPRWIVMLQNGLGGEEQAAQAAPGAVVLGGVCDVACSRIAPATMRHFGHGLVHLAPLQRTPAAELTCSAVAADLAAAGVPVDSSESLVTIRWRKLVWNIAFSGLCTVSGQHTLEVMGDPQLRRRLEAVMLEVITAANADGAPLTTAVIDDFLARTAAMPSYAPSMQLDAQAGRAMELEAIYRIPLQRAHRHGVAMPETTRLLQELEAIEAGGTSAS
jgi:2-dehydropantoate 2-reductase